VAPELLRANFALALFILICALLILPFEDPSSAGFVVTVLAAGVALIFVGAIALMARWSSPRIPDTDDKGGRTRYTGKRPGGP
jgi:hypothetical protein